MNFYLVDLVDLIDIAYDVNQVQTETVRANLPARVSERHRLVVDREGKEVFGQMQILLEAGTVLGYDTKVRVKTVSGVAYALPAKKWQVKQLSRAHLMKDHHVEVWV